MFATAYTAYGSSDPSNGLHKQQQDEMTRRISIQHDGPWTRVGNQRDHPSYGADVVLAGLRAESRHSLCNDNDDRSEDACPHLAMFIENTTTRRLEFPSSARDLLDAASNFPISDCIQQNLSMT